MTYIAYTIFTDAEMTNVRQFAEASGTKAEKIRTAFKNIKGGSLKTGDVICGCRIDRLDSEDTPVH